MHRSHVFTCVAPEKHRIYPTSVALHFHIAAPASTEYRHPHSPQPIRAFTGCILVCQRGPCRVPLFFFFFFAVFDIFSNVKTSTCTGETSKRCRGKLQGGGVEHKIQGAWEVSNTDLQGGIISVPTSTSNNPPNTLTRSTSLPCT